MELAGAAAASAAGADTLCPRPLYWIAVSFDRSAICTSSQVLQAFSWICGFFRGTTTIPSGGAMLGGSPGEAPTTSSTHRPPRQAHTCKRRLHIVNGGLGRAELQDRCSPAVQCSGERPDDTARRISKVESWRYSTFRISQAPGHEIVAPIPAVAEAQLERPLPPAPLPLAPQQPTMVTRQATAAMPLDLRRGEHHHKPPRQSPAPSPIGDWPRLDPGCSSEKRKSNAVPPLVAAQVEETRHRRLQSFPPLRPDSTSAPERIEGQLAFPRTPEVVVGTPTTSESFLSPNASYLILPFVTPEWTSASFTRGETGPDAVPLLPPSEESKIMTVMHFSYVVLL
ncbi:hypothetical protein NMY22_g7261 [Coprinellus aureogranulatus]|nr:hypothetical protein NMY22_g7261 [Coprinellus aureogranulatus]